MCMNVCLYISMYICTCICIKYLWPVSFVHCWFVNQVCMHLCILCWLHIFMTMDMAVVLLLSPTVPAECPVSSTVSGCSTCCCTSSDNVEFYVPSIGEPTCTAPAAVYEIRFVATWTAACHPDYYFGSAHWSPLTGISHKPEYELWDACMYDVSQGVAVVSQTGSTCKLYFKHNLVTWEAIR